MNAKYILALILALQVSMSLCDIPAPSQELVERYEELKNKFYKRLLVAYGKGQAAVAPVVEHAGASQHGQATRDFVEDMQGRPEVQAIVKVAGGLLHEAGPVADTVRSSVLGWYERYLRPYIGNALNDGIDHVKLYLDKIAPAE